MTKYALLLFTGHAMAGPYIEVGLGVPLSPETGYIPDQYGIFAAGYRHPIDEILSVDIGYNHKSLTGNDYCNNSNCNGDNAVEAKIRLEF